ncbi:GNAT family N-acetyltransferase [Streptomyces sp. NPDC058459]|uniref:GNAT family N-acetyltransferase n=1 Tax=Streptomyces sp. NPDC058459 TaxID=3346508 RepID=UPI003659D06D
MSTLTVRPMALSDCDRVAEIRVTGWRHEIRTGDAELYALYADPAHIGTGVGRVLLAEALACTAGRPRVLVRVLRDNTRARRFYERAGFRPDGAEDGASVPEVRYVRSQLRRC